NWKVALHISFRIPPRLSNHFIMSPIVFVIFLTYTFSLPVSPSYMSIQSVSFILHHASLQPGFS
ncbi:hypothetical protein HN51_058966, partial [Arachis hypogaea]